MPSLIHFTVTGMHGYVQHGWTNCKLLKAIVLSYLSTESGALLLLPTILLKKIKKKPKPSLAEFHISKYFAL